MIDKWIIIKRLQHALEDIIVVSELDKDGLYDQIIADIRCQIEQMEVDYLGNNNEQRD